jgi:hypothetical protein
MASGKCRHHDPVIQLLMGEIHLSLCESMPKGLFFGEVVRPESLHDYLSIPGILWPCFGLLFGTWDRKHDCRDPDR